MKAGTVATIVGLCALVAFGLGFWPQYQQRQAAESRLAEMTLQAETLRSEAATSADRVRMGQYLAQLLVLQDVTGIQNYGKAQELSTVWFDGVRAGSQSTPNAEFRKALESSLVFRDQLTAALTRGDAESMTLLTSIEEPIRAALGFPAVRIQPEAAAFDPPAP